MIQTSELEKMLERLLALTSQHFLSLCTLVVEIFWVRKRKTCYYLTFALNIVQFSFGWTIKLNRFRPNNKSLINKLKLFLLAFFVSFRWAWYGKWLIRGWMKRIKLWIRPKVCQVRGPWTFVHCVRVNNAVGHGRELTWVRQCWWISRMDTGAR